MKRINKFIVAFLVLLPQVAFAANKVSCGEVGHGGISGIPSKIPELLSFFITVIQVVVAVILIILGSLDLFKGITSGKEDEIKKGQQLFIKRLIAGALVFFIVLIVKLLMGAIAEGSSSNIIDCIDCFINNSEACKNDNSTTVGLNDSNESKSRSYEDETEKTKQKTIEKIKDASKKKSTDSNKKDSNNPDSSNSKSSVKNNTLFIGDSEVVLMCENYGLCNNVSYLAEGGVWCDYLNTVESRVNNMIKSKDYNIVIILGFNGAGTSSSEGKDEAERCFNIASSLAKNEWKNQNVVYVSVNPCDDDNAKASGMYITNSAINSFNSTMKSKITSSKISNMSYCDTNSSLNIKEIDLGDGAHYSKSGEQQVYNTIMNKCLK